MHNIVGIFWDCKSLKEENIISKDAQILKLAKLINKHFKVEIIKEEI